ncbi:MAG: ATP-binding protein [Thermoprotei archaeon]|nr:MAG: ATP-binding protein [Thermoprotei archaeon]
MILWISMPLGNVVEVHDLTKSFGNIRAVDGVSFSVRKGEIYGLLGPNGAGKTTTVRMTIGIITPDRGEAYIMGYNVHREPIKARSFIGVVPEISNPYVDLTVWENLMLIGGIYCVPKEIRIRRAESLLKVLEIYEARNRKAKALSKGMRRRLLLAMALMSDPDILFLDEPTSGLDVISARVIRSLLLKLKEQGKTIILTTHNIDEAGMLCDRVAIMNKGKIIAMGTPEELKIKFGEYTRILLCFNREVDIKLIKKYFDSYETIVQGRRLVIVCRSRDLGEILDQIICIAKEYNLNIEELQASGLNFEDVFIRLIRGRSR